ncbi:MAG: 3-deoxy-manno-octulosonate cytidylyltransferase [Pseudomonadales bacterium]
MSFTVIIPARYASSRLPGKPLCDIAGKAMIQRVFEAASASKADRVFVATDDDRVHDAVLSFGGASIMTSKRHSSGTDRLQEAAELLQLEASDIVVNVQGDEPLIPAAVINQVAENLAGNDWASLATLAEPIDSEEELHNPNVVKVLADEHGRALYFSRAPIPYVRDRSETQLPVSNRHVGLYAYRVSFLNQFIRWPEHSMERAEKLEQLRALANGAAIHLAQSVCDIPVGVDTEEDLLAIRQLLAGRS